jgi:hypothetical protein
MAIALVAPTDATASTIEGGRADVADMARRLASSVTCSASRQRALAYLQGVRRAAERQNSWQAAGSPPPMGSRPC